MAAADYLLCDNCDGKAVYDPGLDLNASTYGELLVLCSTCTDQGYRLVLTPPPTAQPKDRP